MLFDFGLAKLWQTSCDEPADAPRQLTGQTGSARYMAPEVARSRPYGTSAEVYSFGILLWQLASHERPFAGMDMQRHARQVGLAAAWCVVLVANTPPPLLRPIQLLRPTTTTTTATTITTITGRWSTVGSGLRSRRDGRRCCARCSRTVGTCSPCAALACGRCAAACASCLTVDAAAPAILSVKQRGRRRLLWRWLIISRSHLAQHIGKIQFLAAPYHKLSLDNTL